MQDSIQLTDAAIAQALQFQRDNIDFAAKPLRVYLAGKGCDGFEYGVSFDDPSPQDMHFSQGLCDVIVDPDSFVFLKGAQIDWVDDERGRGFLVENPRHRKFRGKFYRRTNWQESL